MALPPQGACPQQAPYQHQPYGPAPHTNESLKVFGAVVRGYGAGSGCRPTSGPGGTPQLGAESLRTAHGRVYPRPLRWIGRPGALSPWGQWLMASWYGWLATP